MGTFTPPLIPFPPPLFGIIKFDTNLLHLFVYFCNITFVCPGLKFDILDLRYVEKYDTTNILHNLSYPSFSIHLYIFMSYTYSFVKIWKRSLIKPIWFFDLILEPTSFYQFGF